jgi:ABC-type proline/glycine betaine transport system substrate-binding protein
MVAAIDTDGKSAAEAARAWVGANESIWKAWMP